MEPKIDQRFKTIIFQPGRYLLIARTIRTIIPLIIFLSFRMDNFFQFIRFNVLILNSKDMSCSKRMANNVKSSWSEIFAKNKTVKVFLHKFVKSRVNFHKIFDVEKFN